MSSRLLCLLAVLCLGASLLGLAAVVRQHQVRTFGTVEGLPTRALDRRPASILGVNVSLEQYADPAGALQPLAGIPWLRQSFAWDAIEPAPGELDWSRWDALVEAATANGHELIAVLGGTPEWARAPGSTRTGPPVAPEAFADFAGRFAARYGQHIDVYQVWDEPNIAVGWGNTPPSAAGYAALLQGAYAAIHAADPGATVLAAALAPTVEEGPDNLSDLIYLQQVYDLGAAPYFDAVAGKPYGFYTGPADRLADPAVLNFSRFTLLRRVMERNGDGHKLLWGGNFGWNTLASPWGQATADEQLQHTLDAFDRAEREWPWAGVMALENYQPAAPPADPHWGFALVDAAGNASPLLAALQAQAEATAAFPGNYGHQHPAAAYTGPWEFSELGADIPEDYANASLTITFEGADLGLWVRRGDYRGYLYVEVDGRPANQLPRDERGAYLVLTSPDLSPQVNMIPVAAGLAPGQTHTAVIRPERGWDQWALVGFAVGGRSDDNGYWGWAAGLLAAAVIAAAAAVAFGRRASWEPVTGGLARGWQRLGTGGQVVLTAAVSGLLYLTSWLTWGNEFAAVSRRFGDTLPLALTALSAGLFYFSPSLLGALLALVALFVLFYLRLDLALAFTAFFIPLYLQYRLLWQRGFSMVEVCTLLALGAWLLRFLRPGLAGLAAGRVGRWQRRVSFADWAVLAYALAATLSLLGADLKVVAVREFRLVVAEPVIFYFLVRLTPLDRRELVRLADFFVLGALAVAAFGLYQYAACTFFQADTCTDLITAEGGVMRIRSVYGSPNNLGLYLGRALPLAAAMVVFARQPARRAWYLAASLVLGAATLLTFSKGALLLGVPAGLAVVLVAWQGRRGLLWLAGGLAAGLAALPLLRRLPRFASLLDLGSGTSFFRLRLWQSATRMFLDNPWLGVGPDNFLYEYRSRYILPDAWQEPNLSHPHNLPLDFLSRLGLLGTAAGVALLVAFWRSAVWAWGCLRGALPDPAAENDRRLLLALAAGCMGLVADMLAHGLVDHGFFLVDLAYAFFLALASVQHVGRLAPARVKIAGGSS